MKVLEPGRPQKGWSKECKCTGKGNGGGGCGAKLLVEKGDLFQTSHHVRDESEYYITFACPQCGVLTDIEAPFRASELPQQKKPDESDK